MTGNVREWCWDWYGPYSAWPAHDPAGPTRGKVRVIRGGSWGMSPVESRTAGRSANEPTNRWHALGFRLARSAPAASHQP
jgi:formylglycine-generating enzyme required for sulfatase activity